MITQSIKYIGVQDNNIDLFEGQYKVPNGISYNSYLIVDEKCAVMDTVDKKFGDEWLENIEKSLGGRAPDYLIVLHMEPDHSANIARFAEKYPNAVIVSSAKSFAMMKNFFGNDYSERRITVGEGDILSLGEHELTFVTAPMVHWPEVILAYEKKDKVLFSADAFGKFGGFGDDDGETDEARRYYIGIVGKYGAQVTALLKKASALDIDIICPLHSTVIKENISKYIALYEKWASYTPEEDGVVIAYASVYGNTKAAAELLYSVLKERGANAVIYDLARCDQSYAVADAFRYSKLVLASTTYNADVFPPMREFINHLTERGFKKRTVAFIENGSWAPMAAKVMRGMLDEAKELEILECGVKILSAVSEENKVQIKELAKSLI